MEIKYLFLMLNVLFGASVSQIIYEYNISAQPLNCSQFGVNATNVSQVLINWQSRLHSCFASYTYDITQLSVPSHALPLVVYFDWALFNLLSFQDGILTVAYQLTVTWMDYMRSWNPLEVPVASIQVPIQNIWYPQFLFMEAIDKKYVTTLSTSEISLASIQSDGLVSYVSGTVVKGKCSLNLWNFPFDIQTCNFSFLLNRFHDNISPLDVVVQKSPYAFRFKSIANDEWEILSTHTAAINLTAAEYKYRADGSLEDTPFIIMPDATTGFGASIRLRRYSNFYVVNIICPLMALAVLDMLPFAMEDAESEKLVTAVAIVSAFMFLQGIVANLLPKSDVTPNLAIYVAACLVVSSLSVIPEVFCYSLCYRRGEPSRLVQVVVLRGLGILLYPSQWIAIFKRWLTRKSKVEVVPATATGIFDNLAFTSASDKAESGSWREVAHVANRLFALMHVVISLTLSVVFLAPIFATSIYFVEGN